MTIALLTLYQLASDNSPNRSKVAAAVAIAAVTILTEDVNTVSHAARLAWAQKALLEPNDMATKMIWGVLSDANVQAAGANASDAVIQTSVNTLVNGFLNA